MIFITDILKRIVNKHIYIYGAGVMGKALKKCIKEINMPCDIDSFVVGERGNNPYEIDEMPVKNLGDETLEKNSMILVALHEKNVGGVIKELYKEGFQEVCPITFDSDEWCDIRLFWLMKHLSAFPFGVEVIENKHGKGNEIAVKQSKVTIYVARSVYDKMEKQKPEGKCEKFIQVGAALTDKVLCSIRDNVGENISEKNMRFCELTGMYWVWKNDHSSDYKGICHYRRRFVLSDEDFAYIKSGKADVVLTVPILNFDTVGEQFRKDHISILWDITRNVIADKYAAYLEDFDNISNGIMYFGYNMCIAKAKIYDEYCEWLFAILLECEKIVGDLDDRYQNRYAGFIAERLLSVYLRHHRMSLNIVMANKHFEAQGIES